MELLSKMEELSYGLGHYKIELVYNMSYLFYMSSTTLCRST